MKDRDEIEKYLASFPDVYKSKPFGDDFLAYKVKSDRTEDAMFALIRENTNPLQISLKCDSQLAQKLRQEYETVMPALNLNKKYWNTIICTGQVSEEDMKSLISISYNMATR